MGGGGKSAALRLLAGERAVAGEQVVATTTTSMHEWELAAAGPLVLKSDPAALAEAGKVAAPDGIAVAAGRDGTGKVAGLPPRAVDALRRGAAAACLIVEADGSRGRSLKAFGAGEPAVPDSTSTIVQIAGVDALGRPLDAEAVHRPELLAAELGVSLGHEITADLFAAALRGQLTRLRAGWPSVRIVTLLNKAEGPEDEAAALDIARRLVAPHGGAPGAVTVADGERPDAVVVGSVHARRFVRVCAKGERDVVASHDPRTVSAIVLAAGSSSRMGVQKLLLPLGGRPLVQWSVDAALASTAQTTTVVVGHEADEVTAALRGRPLRFVVNPDYGAGMSTSLKAGIEAVQRECDAVLVLLADQPFVTAALLDALVARFLETGARVVRPSLAGRPAHPVLVHKALFPELLAQKGDVGGRVVVERHVDEVSLVPVDEAFTVMDIDTIEEYEAARETV